MNIKQVVIPIAGDGKRLNPLTKSNPKELLPVVRFPLIHYQIKECLDSGVEKIVLIISRKKMEICKYFSVSDNLIKSLLTNGHMEIMFKKIKIVFVIQEIQSGLLNAISLSEKFLSPNTPFGIILGDDLITNKLTPLNQLMNLYQEDIGCILGVQEVEEKELHKYGIIKYIENKNKLKLIEVIEKPINKKAPSNKAICGRYIFSWKIFEELKICKDFIESINKLINTYPSYGVDIIGKRYDFGSFSGFIKAQIDFGLQDPELKEDIEKHIKNIVIK